MEKKLRTKLRNAIKGKLYEDIMHYRHRLSEMMLDEKRVDEAVDELKDLLTDLAGDKNKIRKGQAYRLLGETLQDTSDYKLAVDYFKKYLSLAKEENDIEEQQRAHSTLGRYYFIYCQSAESESEKKDALGFSYKHNLKGLELARKLEEAGKVNKKDAALMKARLYMNMALCFELEGRIGDAEQYAEDAVKVSRVNGCSTYDVAKCLSVLANIKSLRDSAAGLKIMCEALQLAETVSEKLGKVLQLEILEAKADLHFAQGDFSQAKKCLCEAYKLNVGERQDQITKNLKIAVFILKTLEKLCSIEEDDFLVRKKLFEQMGDCCVQVKALRKAVDYYEKMLEYSQKLGDDAKSMSPALISIAASYADLRKFSKAIEYYERERELWLHEPKEEFRSRINLASLYEKRSDSAKQLEQLSFARTLATTSGDPKLQIEVLTLLQIYHKNNSESNDDTMFQVLEDEISNLRAENSSQETCSQPMDIEDVVEFPYDNIDLSDLPELQPDQPRGQRQRRATVVRNEKGETRLHTACIKGNMASVKVLVNNGHPVTVYDQAGWTPIHEAANWGHLDIINFLLDRGANINDQGKHGVLECDGITPLIDACTNGHLTVIELLLDRGARVDMKTVKPPRINALNALNRWYGDNRSGLSEEDRQRYENIRQRMVEMLTKAGEKVVETVSGAASSVETEFILNSDDENQKTVQNKRLQAMRRAGSQLFSDGSDSDIGQMRRRKETQKVMYSDDEDSSASRRKSRLDYDAEPSTSSGRRGGANTSVNDYRHAMDSMKRRNLPTQPGAPSKYSSQAVPALLPESEVTEDWLENDLGPSTSRTKRRRSSESRSESASRGKRTRRRTVSSSSSSSSPSPMVFEREASVSPIMIISNNSNNSGYHTSDGEEIVHPVRTLRKISPVKKSPIKRRIISSPKKASPKKSSAPEENINIRVKFETMKTYLVPINSRNITIANLAEKTAARYYKIEGMEPKLTLTTADGAILSPDDLVGVILRPGEFDAEICAVIESLKLPPLPSRYKEACKLENTDEDEHILQKLEGSQATFEINFRNLPLGPQLVPLLKSIFKEASLQILNLSGCSIEDTGLEMLCNTFKSLENLSSLNLSCNYITSKGLEIMSQKVGDEKSLQALRQLDLSHNTFGEEGLNLMSALLDNLDLASLNLSDCDLALPDTPLEFTLALESMKELNVSYNSLGCEGISLLFGRLNAWNLKKLNLAYTSHSKKNEDDSDSVAKELALLFQKVMSKDEEGGVLSELNLCGCNLKDTDIWELLSAANDCRITIQRMKVSCNPKLSPMILQFMMDHTPSISELTATGCPNLCTSKPELSINMNLLSIICSKEGPSSLNKEDGVNLCGPGGFFRLSH